MRPSKIKPPFDVESIEAVWSDANRTIEGSPTLLYRRAVRAIRASRLSRRKSWPLDVAHPSANLKPTARYTGRLRRLWLDRGPLDWVPKSERAIDLWREGCQKPSNGPIPLDNEIDPHNVAWLVQLTELIGDRNERAGKTAWASALYFDFLRSANHLRPAAPLEQARFVCAMEMRIGSELRHWSFAKKTTAAEIRNALEELDLVWADPIPIADHFSAEYARLFGSSSHKLDPPHSVKPKAVEDVAAALLWFWELADQSTSARTRLLRQRQQLDGTSVMQPLVTKEFCQRYELCSPKELMERLKQASVQSHLARFETAISYFDQCIAARAATRATLIVAAYQKEKGYYPQELATACESLNVPLPIDPYSHRGGEIRYVRSPGQRMQGMGLDWDRQRIRTRAGQPIVYSVGADGDDDRCTTIWNRRLTGGGDWAFPMSAVNTPRRWLQFDTRTILTAFTIFAMLFGIRMSPPGRQRAAIAIIEEMGGSVEYTETMPKSFVERWLGQEYGGTASSICLNERQNLDRLSRLLPYLPEVETLDLTSCTLTESDFDRIARMPNISTLNLNSATFPGGSLSRLSALRKLKSVDIGDSNANDDDLAGLANCKSLTNIDCCRTKITGPGFAHLSGMASLNQLVVIGSPITDDGLQGIGMLKNLNHLDLDSTPINGRGLAHLSGLQQLATLDIRATQIDDDGLMTMPALPALTSIYLHNSKITGPGLVRLSTLPKLSELTLGSLKITDDSLRFVSGYKTITSLGLDSCKLKGTGLKHLHGLKTLSSIDLTDNPIDNEHIRELKKALPDLTVEE